MSDRRQLSSPERLALIAFGMIAAQLIFRGWATAGSWFYSDDFIFIGTAARGAADLDWMFEPHNIHLMPFGLWLSTLVGNVGTFSWLLATVEILLLQALASLACWWMLRTLFGDRKGVLVALAFYLVSPLSFPSIMWWSASLNQLPHQIALFGAVAAHVMYLRTRHPSSAVLAGLFMLLGYASYTKTLLLPVLLVSLTVVYFATGRLLPRLRTALVRFWHAWVVYGVLTIGYLVIYLTTVPRSEFPGWRSIRDTFDLSIVKSFAPGVLGGPWDWVSLGQPGGVGPRLFVGTPLMLIAFSWVAIALLCAYQFLKVRRAWLPLLVLVPYLLLNAYLVSAGRSEAFGVGPAALELRYLADLAGVVALCIALATMPIVGAAVRPEPRDPQLLTVSLPTRALKVGAAAIVVGSLFSSVAYALPWHDSEKMPQQAYVDTARAALDKAGNTEIADTTVPDSVLWAAAFPANLTSRILAPLDERFTVVKAGNDLKLIGPDGALSAAAVLGEARTEPGPDKGCGFAVTEDPRTISIVPVIDFSFWLSINYLAGADGTATIRAGKTTVEAPIERGPHTLLLQTSGAYDSVTITPASGVSLCVDKMNVGPLTAVGAE
ncbi:hypothetical protein J2X11_001926 [Aeromicrobium panaciterrae]|uniref:Glycosyltransferase RgtA/B/C/D-like domain-containing protein n=1 Tax=Aeromicrobium panaciterrae TaxID=363861 RepID=A0ABU1UPI9_9ACTN|nr:hypothetical protein [Aeromicrobium panaciterrae]MDR7087087.1 hypothetical protein [Aeromicrobium panaciterrae]